MPRKSIAFHFWCRTRPSQRSTETPVNSFSSRTKRDEKRRVAERFRAHPHANPLSHVNPLPGHVGSLPPTLR